MLPDLIPHLEICQQLISQVQVCEANPNQKSRRSIIVDAIQGKKANQQPGSFLSTLAKAQGHHSRFYVAKSQYQQRLPQQNKH